MIELFTIPITETTCETFCHDCGQLRLWGMPEKVTACGNCGSERIETGPIGGDRLPELRTAWRKEHSLV